VAVSLVFGLTAGTALFIGASGTLIHALNPSPRIIAVSAAEAALNLGLSILLLPYFGLVGVALGTLIARLATMFWFAPIYVTQRSQGRVGYDFPALVEMAVWPIATGVAMLLLDPRMSGNWWAHLFVTIVALVSYFFVVSWRQPDWLTAFSSLLSSKNLS
jgi:peptidoglycan biosynthesis protein MviN/MurJ (putative lipid II flippase)